MSASKYKILSHTADLRLEVYGKTLEELFRNGAEAIADILSPKIKFRKSDFQKLRFQYQGGRTSEYLKIKSANLNTLLVDFLNEIVARSHINKAVYFVRKINIQEVGLHKGSPTSIKLECELVGQGADEFEEDIKAVTYHEVNIKQENGIWRTKLLMDI